jgi:SWI/SNF-related matrix-associated actin-dependent regulator 1 of chromatin subfamily A
MSYTNTNRYRGCCNNCGTPVDPGAGFIAKENGRWVIYCKTHLPTQINFGRKELTADGRFYFPYSPDSVILIKSLPGARFVPDGEKHWTVSTAEKDRFRLLEVCAKLGVEVPEAIRSIRVTEQAKAALDSRLYPFQVEGVNWLSQQDAGLLLDEQGLGKTIEALVSLPKDARVLAVVPATVKYNWSDETAKWRPDYKAVVLSGRESFRWPEVGEVLIVNYDILPSWLVPQKNEQTKALEVEVSDLLRKKAAETVLIVDEIHRAKNYKALRSKKIKGLSLLCGRRWGLTGTPLPNRPGDLFGVLSNLDLIGRTFRSWERFLREFGAYRDRWGGIKWGIPSALVPEILRRVSIRRRRVDVLPELPRKTYKTLVVNDLDGALVKKLDGLWTEWADLIEGAGELPPFEELSAIRAELAESRIPAMLEVVEDYEETETPLLVFSKHRTPINALASREGWETITGDTPAERRQQIVRDFQAGNLKGIGLTILAGGVGLTLTQASHTLFVDLEWNPCDNVQAEDRTCRIGQKAGSVVVTRMVSNHVVDLRVQELLAEKIRIVEAAVEASVVVNPNKFTAENETDEQYKARVEAIREAAEEAEKKAAKEKSARILDRERSKAEAKDPSRKTRIESQPVENGKAEAIREAIRFLSSVCDGAVERDNTGFNKADAYLGKVLAASGLDTEGSLRAAWYVVSRYPRQVKDRWPVLFN